MDDKITISDFGIEQSEQFEANNQFAPQQFFQEAKAIYSKTVAIVDKENRSTELDTLFNTQGSNRSFASFSFPQRIKEGFFLLGASQPMQSISGIDKLHRMIDLVDTKKEAQPENAQDLKQALGIVANYCKDAQQIRNQIISVGKG
ncbi:MAG: DUF5399 family protein [Chlamydiia bacterium]